MTEVDVVFSVPVGSWPASITNYSEEAVADLVQQHPDYHFFVGKVSV